jgi:hypothetical protein
MGEAARPVEEAIMPYSTTLPILAALSVAAIGVGVHLGRATTAEINPAYQQDSDTPFYADLVPQPRSAPAQGADWQQAQAQEYQTEAAAPPPPAACIGCTWPVAPAPRHDPSVDRALEAWTPRSAMLQAEAADPAPDVEVAEVVRYAAAPVRSAQVEQASTKPHAEPKEAQAAPQPDGL